MQVQVINFEIDGQVFPPPVNWRQFQITATFNDDDVQAELDVDEFVLVNESAYYISDAIDAGRTGTGQGIFQGLSFLLTVSDSSNSLTFQGYLDLTTVHFYAPNKVAVKLRRLDLEDIHKKLESITYQLLLNENYVSPLDYTAVKYVVEKEFSETDLVLMGISTYIMAKELAEQVRTVASRVAELAAAIAMVPPQPSQIAKVAVLLALDLAYAAVMIIALVKLIKEMVELIYPPTLTHQGITFRRALEKAFRYFGFTFTSPIPELDWTYVPSKPQGSSRVNEGIPNPQDVGYRASEMLDLCKVMFNARIRVNTTTNTVELLSLNNPLWQQNSSFVMLDHLDEEVEYNADQIVQTRLVTFIVDQSNYWTVENYKGTAYEVTYLPVTPPTAAQAKFKTIKGLDEVRIPLSLASRKDKLSNVEQTLFNLISVVDQALSIFRAGGTGLSAKIKNRVGIIKQGTKYHAVPQVVLWEGGKIPANYRDIVSAKALYNKYIIQKSLADDNAYSEQKRVFKERKRAMTLDGFVAAIQNKAFTTQDSKKGEFDVIKWGFDLDFAVVDYKVREVYTRNLKTFPKEPA